MAHRTKILQYVHAHSQLCCFTFSGEKMNMFCSGPLTYGLICKCTCL